MGFLRTMARNSSANGPIRPKFIPVEELIVVLLIYQFDEVLVKI